jgi:chromosome segregation ATPase
MPSDTTDDETTRPTIPIALADDVASEVTHHVRIPADRLTFAEQLQVLLEEYREVVNERNDLEAECSELRSELENARATIDEQRQTIDQLQSRVESASGGVLGR